MIHELLHFLGLCRDSYLHPNIISILTGFNDFYFAWFYFKNYFANLSIKIQNLFLNFIKIKN